MLSNIIDQEPVESHASKGTANSVSFSPRNGINTLSTIEEAFFQSIKSTHVDCGCSSDADTNEIISQLASDYDLSVSTYPYLVCSNSVSSNSPTTFNFSSGSHDGYKDLASLDYNITIDVDDGFDYFREECNLQEHACSVSTAAEPVLGCTFEEAPQNIFHPVSPTASLYDQLNHRPSAFTECNSSMVALFSLSDYTPESDYDYSIEQSLPIERETARDLGSSASATPTIACNNLPKSRRQVWNKLTRWWHRQNSKGEIVNEDSSSNAEVKDKEISAFAILKADVKNDDHQSISCSSCDIFEQIDCTSSSASSVTSSAKYSSDNGTLEDDDYSLSVSSSLVAKYSDDDYSPSISSSLVAERDDDETLYFSNKVDMIGSDWLTMQTSKTGGHKKTKTMLLGSWSDLLYDEANRAYISDWPEIDENILKN
ncbi:unnamed protein product [Ambrosiozyma monospora]|uniref:Unnamed protein product n=1 Tax=Ambrosiozyma monospora TaxID=43982 RepID=A0A9W6YU10_AMBMO|nr:unnamed protein product [Ambrosiozyma monospora]